MIRAIIFDCFGVLQVNSSEHFLRSNIDNFDELHPEIIQIFKACDYGLINQDGVNEAVAELTGLELGLIAENIQGTHVRNTELMQRAAELRAQYKIAMLSNIGPGSMDQFFGLSERQELFDAVVLSGEEYITKPHPRIYELCAERLGVSPSDCVMIDDSLDNCYGADAAGMKFIHYHDNRQAMAELDQILND